MNLPLVIAFWLLVALAVSFYYRKTAYARGLGIGFRGQWHRILTLEETEALRGHDSLKDNTPEMYGITSGITCAMFSLIAAVAILLAMIVVTFYLAW
jgi:hypothetical protein